MSETFLHVGCGKRVLPGFVNIDIGPEADVRVDVRGGLPFPDESVNGVLSEHFIEHLTLDEGTRFLRECRRVVKPGGRVRISTPDLDLVVHKYSSDWQNQEWMRQFNYDWIPNRCYMLNLAMREWEHRWVYNEEELRRAGLAAGFADARRCQLGVSDEPRFCGVEYRPESLILEFIKPAAPELVSILIPAYHSKYFPAALESALRQTYRNSEIVICDDSPDNEIANHVASHAAHSAIRYQRNEGNIGSRANYIRCFNLARGDFIKFLNDDDLLAPTCVERMAVILRALPEVTLVTSHRQRIDDAGRALPDTMHTQPIVPRDTILDGKSTAAVMIAANVNFIGEPTTTMFRKRDADGQPDFMSFGGVPLHWNVDMAIWSQLLLKGQLCFLAERLSAFRCHGAQEQRQADAEARSAAAIQQLRAAWVREAGPLPNQLVIQRRRVLS